MLYLAVDGGGTGCRAAVADRAGQILGKGSSGPANILSDPDGALANILSACDQALAQAMARRGDVVVVLGLAGANVPGAVARLRAGLPFAARIEADGLTALKGAHHDDDGIVATLGTGSVFFGQRSGQVRTVGGWGLVLGDEGSGAWLGRAALAGLVQAADGFAALTPFLADLAADYGGAPGAVAFAGTASPSDFAAIAPRVVAAQDDPAATAILVAGAALVARAVDQLQTRPAVPVAFLGGLGAVYAQRLAGRWPVRLPYGTALDGALWLARAA